MVSRAFFKRDEAEGYDYVRFLVQPSLYIIDEPF